MSLTGFGLSLWPLEFMESLVFFGKVLGPSLVLPSPDESSFLKTCNGAAGTEGEVWAVEPSAWATVAS